MNEFIDVQSKVSTQWGKVHQEADGSGSSAMQQGSERRHWVSSLGCTELARTVMHTGRQITEHQRHHEHCWWTVIPEPTLSKSSVWVARLAVTEFVENQDSKLSIATEPESPGRIWIFIWLTKSPSDFCLWEFGIYWTKTALLLSISVSLSRLQTVVEEGGRCE